MPARRDALLTTPARRERYGARIGQIEYMCRDWINWADKRDGPFTLKVQQEFEQVYQNEMPQIFRWARKHYDWSWANYYPSEKAETITVPLTKEKATLAAYSAIERIVCVLDDGQVERDEDGEPILSGDREQFQRDFEGDGDCGIFHPTEAIVLLPSKDGKRPKKVKINYLKQLKARYEKALSIIEEDLGHAETAADEGNEPETIEIDLVPFNNGRSKSLLTKLILTPTGVVGTSQDAKNLRAVLCDNKGIGYKKVAGHVRKKRGKDVVYVYAKITLKAKKIPT